MGSPCGQHRLENCHSAGCGVGGTARAKTPLSLPPNVQSADGPAHNQIARKGVRLYAKPIGTASPMLTIRHIRVWRIR